MASIASLDLTDTVKSPVAENVVIKDETIIGDHTFIDAGAVIGCEGILYIEGGRI
jgi:UDP-3-O-[3-hydroxymyristoyl] glucosamine N-acyltransferase